MRTKTLLIVLFIVTIWGCDRATKTNDVGGGSSVSFTGNVFLDSILPDKKYKFLHGSSSPDNSKMVLMVNQADLIHGSPSGVTDLYMLDAAELEKGKVKLLNKGSITGDHSGPWESSLAFRSSWSVDGKIIALAGGDRLWVLDADTLKPIGKRQGDKGIGGQAHDAMFSTDSRYALITLWVKSNDPNRPANRDGHLQLYDIANQKVVGESISVCNSCHGHTRFDAALCGLDGTLSRQDDGSYQGSVYVAGYGGHFSKVEIVVDPTNNDKPLRFEKLTTIEISKKKFTGTKTKSDGTSQYKFHDLRLDGDLIYWSTYNTDENEKLHYGKVDLKSGKVTDLEIRVDPRATLPRRGKDKMPLYCASGQTKTAYMPMTMSNEAYISVFPKKDIN